jgi:PAS domain S-box-containing protein
MWPQSHPFEKKTAVRELKTMVESQLTETQKVLISIPAFSGLATEELNALRTYLHEESFPAGRVIFTEGETGDRLYIIKSGQIDIVKKSTDDFAGTVRLARRGPGEIFGEMAVIDDKPRFATAVCVDSARLAVMSRDNFMRLLQSEPDLAVRVLKSMVARVEEADITRLEELERKNVELEHTAARLHKTLKKLKSVNHQLGDALRFRQCLLDVSPFPVIVTDDEMVITYCSPAVSAVFGAEAFSFAGKRISELFDCCPFEQWDDLKWYMQEHDRWESELQVHTPDDRLVYCRVAASPVSLDDRTANNYLFIIHDETEIRLLQQQAAERQRLAIKGEMAAEIAHDMNNYLAVLSGNLELLPMFLENSDRERIDKCLKTLDSSLSRMQVFATAMLSSRLPTLGKVLQDFNRFLENQVAFLKPQREFKKTILTLDLEADLPQFEFDSDAMRQVLYNLILNSVEALGAVTNFEPTVTVKTRHIPQSGVILLEISDNGPGIAATIAGRLFSEPVTTKPGGRGIGLITVKKIIDEHGGTIATGNAGGGGAVFTVEFPVQSDETAAPTQKMAVERPT